MHILLLQPVLIKHLLFHQLLQKFVNKVHVVDLLKKIQQPHDGMKLVILMHMKKQVKHSVIHTYYMVHIYQVINLRKNVVTYSVPILKNVFLIKVNAPLMQVLDDILVGMLQDIIPMVHPSVHILIND